MRLQIKCYAQQNNTRMPASAQTHTAGARVQSTNQEATAPAMTCQNYINCTTYPECTSL